MIRLLIKGTSNIHLEVLLRRSQNFDFLCLRRSGFKDWKLQLMQVLNFKHSCSKSEISCVGAKQCVAFLMF